MTGPFPVVIIRDVEGLALAARRRAMAAIGHAELLELEGNRAGARVWWKRALRHSQVWQAAILCLPMGRMQYDDSLL